MVYGHRSMKTTDLATKIGRLAERSERLKRTMFAIGHERQDFYHELCTIYLPFGQVDCQVDSVRTLGRKWCLYIYIYMFICAYIYIYD